MLFFVTGVCGQLGYDVIKEASKRGHTCIGSDIFDYDTYENTPYIKLDITDRDTVIDTISQIKPDIVIHCAAWTAVDAAEDEENSEKVKAINGNGTENIALACKNVGCKMLYISTDYVFEGLGTTPWEPDCKEFNPLNAYGASKLYGELAVGSILDKFYIVRIAWVFGKNGNNFIKTMLKLSQKYDTLRVVCDQIGTPTYTRDLSVLLVDMSESEKYGYYHATNEGGYISWYDFACEIFRQAGIDITVTPVTTAEYGLSKAARPLNSRLEKKKLQECGFTPLPHWKDALSRYIKELQYE